MYNKSYKILTKSPIIISIVINLSYIVMLLNFSSN